MMHVIAMSRIYSLVIAGAILLSGLSAANAQALSPYSSSPGLIKNLYRQIHHIIGQESSDGAIGVNIAYEQRRTIHWYIEEQRYGGDLIQAGVALDNRTMIDDGIRALEWGFQKEAPDGSFPGTGDPFHSTSLFLEAASRGLNLLHEYDPSAYRSVIVQDGRRIESIADWITTPSVQSQGQAANRPYTHRRWLLAAALSETAVAAGDQNLFHIAREYVRDGLSLQESNGVNPEKGGHDSSYQAYGILQAERYVLADQSSPLRGEALAMIKSGLDWEETRITASGEVSVSGNTRTGVEAGRNGRIKQIDYSAVQQAFIMGGLMVGDTEYQGVADRVAKDTAADGWK